MIDTPPSAKCCRDSNNITSIAVADLLAISLGVILRRSWMHLRLLMHQPCEPVVGGQRHAGHLVKISKRGARVVTTGHSTVGARTWSFAVPIELPASLRAHSQAA